MDLLRLSFTLPRLRWTRLRSKRSSAPRATSTRESLNGLGEDHDHGWPAVGNAMGVNTWAAFAGSNDYAVVDGDFAMYESELQGS